MSKKYMFWGHLYQHHNVAPECLNHCASDLDRCVEEHPEYAPQILQLMSLIANQMRNLARMLSE